MCSAVCKGSSPVSSSSEEAEKEFRKMLESLRKQGRLDNSAREYFSRPLQDRISLQLTLKLIRAHSTRALILDLGCGMGYLEAEICRSRKYECIGLDLNKSFIRLASRRLRLHGYNNASFVLGDLRNLPFRMGRFQFAVLHDVAFAVNITGLMDEISRTLRSGGRFVFDVPLAIFYRLIPIQRPFIKYSKQEITSALKKKGFKEEHIFLLGAPPILHEHFSLPLFLTRRLSRFFMSFPNGLQKLMGEFWYAVIFVARYDLNGAKNAKVT